MILVVMMVSPRLAQPERQHDSIDGQGRVDSRFCEVDHTFRVIQITAPPGRGL
jgi:hypothetical protein